MPSKKSIDPAAVERLMLDLFGDPAVRLLSTEDVAKHLGCSVNAVRKMRSDLGSEGGKTATGRMMKHWIRVPGLRGTRIHPRHYLAQLPASVCPMERA